MVELHMRCTVADNLYWCAESSSTATLTNITGRGGTLQQVDAVTETGAMSVVAKTIANPAIIRPSKKYLLVKWKK